MKYYFDIKNLDTDTQGALITATKKEVITSDEAIARAYEWLNKKDFINFMDWWKAYDYKAIAYANLDEEGEYFIVAIQNDIEATTIAVWEI